MRNVKCLFILFLALIFVSESVVAQKSQSVKKGDKTAPTNTVTANKNTGKNANPKDKLDNSKISSKSTAKSLLVKNSDKAETARAQAAFDELKNVADVSERIKKLNKFIADFPSSELKVKATEMLIVSEIEAGETDFRNSDRTSGAEHFYQAARAFDSKVSDGVFKDLIVKLPFNLFYRGEQIAALRVAKEIEAKINDNPARLLALVNFYLSTENADEAKRVAAHAAQIAPDSAEAQMSLGMAQRIAFHLEASSQAYARALELDPASALAKRNLADAWRGLGQTEDALRLYRELLATNADDEGARNGLVLTLFSTGNKDEAEKELNAALTQNPKNLVLQTNAAYWYAANGDGKRAVELAQQAVEIEPRYVWGQIALARGLILEKRPLEAERALVTARQYGKFPTLDYELANAHFAAGLYDEAADDLRRSFTLKNNRLQTKLAGREPAESENFNELLSRERRASIFEPVNASSEIEARKLKELMALTSNLPENSSQNAENSGKNYDESALLKAAQDFAADADEMRVHRELYAADKLLNHKIALDQILAITQNATVGLETSLDVPAATAAVLADELYEPRRLAAANGSIVNIPTVPRETLRQIMRGRVEEIAGWALYQQDKPEEAAVRLRRAVGVLPENSAWWRSSYWRLGSALEASGKPKEALDAYIKSYQSDAPNETRLVIIQSLYQRVYGSQDGLERRLSKRDAINSAIAQREINPQTESASKTPQPFKNPLPNVIGKIITAKPSQTPGIAETKPISTPEVRLTPDAKTEAALETKVAAPPPPAIKPEPLPEVSGLPTSEAKNEPAAVKPETATETKATPEPSTPPLETKPEPTPHPSLTEIKTEEIVAPESKALGKIEDKIEDKSETKAEMATESVVKTLPAPEVKEAKTEETAIKPIQAPEITVQPPTAANENGLQEKKTDESNPNKNADSAAIEKRADDLFSRPRVVIVPLNNLPVSSNGQTESEKRSPGACVMRVNQSEISILRNGGTVALVVTFSSAADAPKLKISVSSPSDLSVILLPNDDANGNNRLIQISSTSEITKTYVITLESPCGNEEIKVKVR